MTFKLFNSSTLQPFNATSVILFLRNKMTLVVAVILGLLTLVRLLFAAHGHFSEAESYLLLCSHHLDWGFVEGPAGIPVLMRLCGLLGNTPFAMRWLSPMLLLGSSWILWRWVSDLCNRRVAFWAVMTFNLLPLANAAAVVMEGTMFVTLCWLAALWTGWRLIVSKTQKNKISSWIIFGVILAIGTQVSYQIGCLLPLVALASLHFFHNEISDEQEEDVVSSGWKKFLGVLAAILLLAASWLPIVWWNQQHDWLQFQNMTWDSFWMWPPWGDDYFQHLPVIWSLLVLVPLVVVGVCCFSGIWNVENSFFLMVAIPFFFAFNELGHGKAPFALLLVLTALFLPIALEVLMKTKKRAIVALLLLFALGCSSLLLLVGTIFSSTIQESSWNFPSATGVIGTEAIADQLMKLRTTYADTSVAPLPGVDGKDKQLDAGGQSLPEKPESVVNRNVFRKIPFLIAETPGLAAILGAAMPINYPERPGAPSVFIPESPAFDTQFQLWPHYADATTENTTPDPLYTEEKAVSPFLGRDAFYITTEKLEEIPQTITGAFAAVIPLSVTFTLTNNGRPEQLNLYLCQNYQMLSL